MTRLQTPFAASLVLLAVGACSADPGASMDDEVPLGPDAGAVVPATDDSFGPLPAGEVVDFVEVERYTGLWYEVASIPQGFQRNCAATTATYEPIDAVTVSVSNACRIGGLDGQPVSIDGTATIVDTTTNAKLEVDFGFGTSPYWIVDLGVADTGEPYPWAAVSTPGREALWVLSRTLDMPAERFDAIVERLDARGFDPVRLVPTEQPR